MQIVVSDAAVQFGPRTVFEHVNAVFKPGQVTALVGPSGSGKSTLLAAMAGYQKLSAGHISFLDDSGTEHRPDPDLVAWVPQGANVLARRTAFDNVALSPLSEGKDDETVQRTVQQALNAVGLLDRSSQLVRELSGGEVQRVSFARALATSRPLIYADEPSASLDAENTETLARLLSSLHVRGTVVVATHDPILIDAADAVVELRHHHPHDS